MAFPLDHEMVPVFGTRKNKKENGNDTDKAIRPFSVGFRVHPCPFIG